MCSQDSEKAFQIEKENDDGWQGNAFLDELYQKENDSKTYQYKIYISVLI